MHCQGKDTNTTPKLSTSFLFSPPADQQIGTLATYLSIFEKYGVNLKHLESRPSVKNPESFEFLVQCDLVGDIEAALYEIRSFAEEVQDVLDKSTTPWFPRHIKELDKFEKRVLAYGAELEADHPGFTDIIYRKRREYFADIASRYKYGEPLPRVEYTEEEIETWGKVYSKLTSLYPTHACKEHRYIFPLLEQNCGYGVDNIPQLDDVSNYIKDCTGFTLRPAAGFLSSRDFLAGLAFRVFHATQYVRHPSCPFYTPEPDICHELLGHVPLFGNFSFAQFAQEIGLASLGAPDSYVDKLTNCLWFTLEYGMCRENGSLKAYGGGLLSSYGELQYCLQGKAEIRSFDPSSAAEQSYPLTEYQPIYYAAESFEDAKEKIIKYAFGIPRPYGIRYDPYTQSIIVLDKKKCIEELIQNVTHELMTFSNTLKKLK